MKRMKTKIISLILGCMAFFTACQKELDIIKVSGLSSSDLMSSENTLVLTKEKASTSVLALSWNKSTLASSDTARKLPNSLPRIVLEVSSKAGFDTIVQIVPQGNTYSFTGAALNTLAKNFGYKAGESTPMYFRIRSSYGVNTSPYYSDVTTVNITCYTIDMSLGFILGKDKTDTGFKLYSPSSNGEYAGFTGVTGWYNWYLQEGDGTMWGNLGVDGNDFVLSNDQGTFWNFWYPGQGGCYYATLSTTNKEWTATYIPNLSVSGAVTATMNFDNAAVKWVVSFTTTTDNASIKVKGMNAKLYNKSTKTKDDAAAIPKTIGFVPHSDSTLTFDWNSESAGNITISKAGDYTLTFFLSDPKKWTFQIKKGKTDVVEPLSKFLYLPGIDDGISGSWTFDTYINQLSETDSTFAGTVLVNSKYGYNMGLKSGDWANVYKMGSTEGTLKFKGSTNITAPSAGLYLIQADLKHLTYSHTSVTSLSYAGLNDDWTMAAMTASSVPGVYSASVNITKTSQYGCKLYMNGSWDYFYGGNKGVLNYKTDGFKDDAAIGTGTYDLIANIRNSSYAFLGNEVYIGGLNDVWDFTSVVLTKTSIGVYKGTATITKKSGYGIKIYLQNGNWDRFFAGSFNSLKYGGPNITDDQSLAAGSYDVTVDFINNKCSFVAK